MPSKQAKPFPKLVNLEQFLCRKMLSMDASCPKEIQNRAEERNLMDSNLGARQKEVKKRVLSVSPEALQRYPPSQVVECFRKPSKTLINAASSTSQSTNPHIPGDCMLEKRRKDERPSLTKNTNKDSSITPNPHISEATWIWLGCIEDVNSGIGFCCFQSNWRFRPSKSSDMVLKPRSSPNSPDYPLFQD